MIYFFWNGLNPDDPMILDTEPSQLLEQYPGTGSPHVVVGCATLSSVEVLMDIDGHFKLV